MATATQKELLKEARKVDNATREKLDALAEYVKDKAADLNDGPEPHPINELKLHDDDGDPFNGNLNNRRVAARIARGIDVSAGDPQKARADVEQSLKVNPEPIIRSGDELPEIKLVNNKKPSPGSPADLKGKEAPKEPAATTTTEQAAANDKPAVPQWKAAK